MRTIFSFICVLVLALAAFALPVPGDTLDPPSAEKCTSADVHFDVQSVVADGDGFARLGAEMQIVANKLGTLPMTTATAKPTSLNIRRKMETRKSVSNFTEQREFYDVPPNDYGYRGISFANRTRARPQTE